MDLAPTQDMADFAASLAQLLGKACPTSLVRAAEPLGFDRDLWDQLGALSLPTMGVPEERGGDGADLRTLAVLAEAVGRHLAPVPAVEVLVASRLLAGLGVPAEELETTLTTIAVRPARAGTAALVPAGAVADGVVALDGDDLVRQPLPPGVARPAPNLGCLPLATCALHGPDRPPPRVLASGGDARRRFGAAVAEWRLLTAAALVGLAGEALSLGVGYAKSRHQFGVPIGSFQAVAQRLADNATAVDGARLLAYKAAWAADTGRPEAPALASMAFAFATETAQRTAADSLHFHGGYGYMAEYDIQLYFRRAKAWPLVIGDLDAEYALLADLLYGPVGATEGGSA